MAAAKGKPAPRGRRSTHAELLSLAASGMTLDEIGAALGGISGKAVSFRLRARGITKPPVHRRAKDATHAVELYAAGVLVADIAEACGMTTETVRRAARDAGYPARRAADRARSIALNDYRQQQLAARMAETARIEQAQIKLAEMWDQPGHQTSGKRKAA